jgi:hypothetical protein
VFTTVEALKAWVIEIWNAFDQDMIDRICMSYYAKLQRCIDAKGESVFWFEMKLN